MIWAEYWGGSVIAISDIQQPAWLSVPAQMLKQSKGCWVISRQRSHWTSTQTSSIPI